MINEIVKKHTSLKDFWKLKITLLKFGKRLDHLLISNPQKLLASKFWMKIKISLVTPKKLLTFLMIIMLLLVPKFNRKFLPKKAISTFYLDKRDKNGRRFINPDGCTFYLTPVGPDEVEKIIDELDIKKSTGPFGIPVFLLKIFKIFFSI